MRRVLIATPLALCARSAAAQFAPPGRRFASTDPGLALGSQFNALFILLRLFFGPDTADNVTLALPQPVRLAADDALAVTHAQGTSAIHATLGIEYLD